jgi:hypothetical protein
MKSDPDEVREIQEVLKESSKEGKILRVKQIRLNSDKVERYLSREVKLVEYAKGEYKVVFKSHKGEKVFFCGGIPERGMPKYSAVVVEKVYDSELYNLIGEQQEMILKIYSDIQESIRQIGLQSILSNIDSFFEYKDM